jgi:integration host factor subunit alpha
MTLTKDRIIEIIKAKTNVQSQEARDLVEHILEGIKSRLEEGDEVKISGFGKWNVRKKSSRPGRNPHTGTKIEITARRVVTFHPSEKLRQSVNDANLDDSKLVLASGAEDDDE